MNTFFLNFHRGGINPHLNLLYIRSPKRHAWVLQGDVSRRNTARRRVGGETKRPWRQAARASPPRRPGELPGDGAARERHPHGSGDGAYGERECRCRKQLRCGASTAANNRARWRWRRSQQEAPAQQASERMLPRCSLEICHRYFHHVQANWHSKNEVSHFFIYSSLRMTLGLINGKL
jgi:hypothetical protein